ncbi:DEAD-box ATP-dependent RNA helicase 50 [Heracleum sosnowskyi]|uniref:DEAD-box ATP-dependent RNA helicase 50 n=1 Tax=Heracleum sosnowskyi TaxID=360622 RepID=A0AAD8I8J9_9APIA|nr:DEAD-box ATP-dependent RNA helicase 50 [Heracleum sosnowskyi]
MLAKLPPAISFEFRRTEALRRPSLSFTTNTRSHGNNDTTNTTSNQFNWRRNGSDVAGARVSVVVRAAYTRRKLETAGAYELIDDETGDKVIVWGDDDDDVAGDSVISKDVIQWKPEDSKKKISVGTSRRSESVSEGGEYKSRRKAGSKILGGNFGRLKVQKVRKLARTTSSSQQTVDKTTKDRTVDSTNENEKLAVQRNFDALRDRLNVSRASRSQDNQITTRRKAMTREDTENYENVDEDEVDELPKHQTRSPKYQRTDPRSSDARTSAASFRGWSRGVPMEDDYEYRPTVYPKKGKKTNSDSDFFSRKTFKDMGCTEYMIKSLQSRLFNRPSHIQAMAFAPVFEKKSCIIADQSGSGKTLAYLLPLIQRIRQEELEGIGKSLPQNPRVVILVPTAELASQVLTNCRLMSKFGVPFRSMVATGGFKQKTQLESLRQELDVLIVTPGRLTYLVKEGYLQLTNLTCAVLDEVDILYSSEDFEPALHIIMNSSPYTTQYLFVTATLPVNIYNKLVEVFPDCEVIMGPGMHRTSPGLEEILVDCSGDDGAEKTPETAFLNKKTALLRLVEERQVAKTIIFCNKIETCRKVENVLQRFDRNEYRVRALPFHAALAQESRLANMEEFRSSQRKDSLFLVCTDRASRGIDFTGVNHVILFDFPRDPSEYVRRVGRTARGAGGVGKAFVFVVGKQVSLARRIIERNLKGHPLHDVPSAYEQMR